MPKEKAVSFFSIHTLGCKVNQYESEVIAWELKKRGWRPTPRKNAPNLCIINTCTVTGKAAMQARQLIRKMIRQYPGACIVVTGCYTQTGVDEIADIKGVHYIVGQSHKHLLPDIIGDAHEKSLSSLPANPIQHLADIETIREFSLHHFPIDRNRTRPVVKVQDGCNSFCTYCIVPYTRGRSRSLPVSDVIRQINQLHDAGFLEIVLTGIHLGNFGKDLTPKTDLCALVKTTLGSTAIPRIRLSSIEPNEIPDDLVLLMRDSDRICRHFHLPLQSGDNAILKKMNRPYTREGYANQVSLIHRHMPECGIGADVLVGFPGEDEVAFNNTVDLISNLPITYLHVFPFSPRKGTPAAAFPNQVNNALIKERCRILRDIGDQKKLKFYHSLVGEKTSVLLEATSNLKKGMLKGFTSHYVPVHVNASNLLKNSIVDVTITDVIATEDKKFQLSCLGEMHIQL